MVLSEAHQSPCSVSTASLQIRNPIENTQRWLYSLSRFKAYHSCHLQHLLTTVVLKDMMLLCEFPASSQPCCPASHELTVYSFSTKMECLCLSPMIRSLKAVL